MCPSHSMTPLELTIQVPPAYAKGRPITFNSGTPKVTVYDRVIISPTRTGHKKLPISRGRAGSGWVEEEFVDSQSQQRRGVFISIWIRLRDAEIFACIKSAINRRKEFDPSAELTDELVKAARALYGVDDPWALHGRW